MPDLSAAEAGVIQNRDYRMELIFKDKEGNIVVLANSDDLMELKNVASSHYEGDDLIMWIGGPVGKEYSENAPSTRCSCALEDGISYSIL